MNETHFGRLLLLFFHLNFWIEKKGKNVDQLISLFVATKYVLPFGQHVLMKEGFCHFNTKWPNPSFVRTCWPNGNTYLLASNKLSNAQHWRFNLKMYTKITNFQDIFFWFMRAIRYIIWCCGFYDFIWIMRIEWCNSFRITNGMDGFQRGSIWFWFGLNAGGIYRWVDFRES